MTHISVIIFGIVDDNTSAVIKSIWTDYPVIWVLLLLCVMAWLLYKLVGLIRKVKVEKISVSFTRGILIFFVTAFIYTLGARGSVAFYPLQLKDSSISPYVFINNLVINGIYALKSAFADRREQAINTDIESTMRRWDFESPEQAVSIYTGRQLPNDQDSLIAALIDRTPVDTFLQKNPPNVVVILMESMSEQFISLSETNSFNLLGQLEKELPYCLHFTHFLPATGATIHSLEGLMINSPITPVSQSVYMNRKLETSAAKPFKESGYRTSFVTGSELSWRNLDKFVPNQYFDEVEGSAHLDTYYPQALSNEWGCYDEFMFARIVDKLQTDKNKPQFIFAMTTTNHTPYSLPSTYVPYPLSIPANIESKLASEKEHAKIHFLTYQYANDCLGKFIAAIKNSSLGENTIIVATGDHNARRVFEYNDESMLQKYAVPLIIYVPDKYKPSHSADTSCFASHRDIFPTIYNLALSEADYVKSGIDLFSPENASGNFAMAEYNVLMNNNGCVYFAGKPVYYTWTDTSRTQLKLADEKDFDQLDKDLKLGKSFIASMTYLVQKCLSK